MKCHSEDECDKLCAYSSVVDEEGKESKRCGTKEEVMGVLESV